MAFEQQIIIFLQSFCTPFLNGVFKVMSYVFDYPLVIALSIILIAFKKWRECAFFLLLEGIGLGVQLTLKAIIARPRPYMVNESILNILPASNSSFPSGHSITCMMAVVILWVIISRADIKNGWKVAGKVALCFALVLCAINRMYLGQHYITDCLGAYIIALSIGAIIIKLFYNNKQQKGLYEKKEE